MRLRDKIAIITGAGTGIGKAIAQKFSREGARPLFNSLPGDRVPEVAAFITARNGEVEVHLGDVSEAPPSCLKQSSLKSHHRILDAVIEHPLALALGPGQLPVAHHLHLRGNHELVLDHIAHFPVQFVPAARLHAFALLHS